MRDGYRAINGEYPYRGLREPTARHKRLVCFLLLITGSVVWDGMSYNATRAIVKHPSHTTESRL